MKKWVAIVFLGIVFCACKEDVQPKPDGFLALEYPMPEYHRVYMDCPFSFEKNQLANITPAREAHHCWFNLKYPTLNGTIFLTYKPVHDNLRSLLLDAQKLPLEHTIKASGIESETYTNDFYKVYGNFYKVTGDAASQAQFYITDSTNHFLTGSVYFDVRPNYDSIVPAADYLIKDIRHLMESVRWIEE